MTKEEACLLRDDIINDVERIVESGHYTFEEVVDEINDRLVHLVPD